MIRWLPCLAVAATCAIGLLLLPVISFAAKPSVMEVAAEVDRHLGEELPGDEVASLANDETFL